MTTLIVLILILSIAFIVVIMCSKTFAKIMLDLFATLSFDSFFPKGESNRWSLDERVLFALRNEQQTLQEFYYLKDNIRRDIKFAAEKNESVENLQGLSKELGEQEAKIKAKLQYIDLLVAIALLTGKGEAVTKFLRGKSDPKEAPVASPAQYSNCV